jgi:hypothetical protein
MNKLKNKASYGGELLDMDNNVYLLRKKVMNVIYEAKNKGFVLPRVEVRIVSSNTDACAYAYLGKNIIHVNKTYTERKYDHLFTQIILHEMVHAIFGINEVVGCKLMHCTKFWENKVDIDLAWGLFEKYYLEFKKTFVSLQ